MPQVSRATFVRWPVPIALAVPAIAVTLLITFTPGHTVWFGFLVFAAFALLTAAGASVGIALLPFGVARVGAIAKTVASGVAGITALVVFALSAFTPVTAPVGELTAAWSDNALALSLTIAITFVVLAAIDLIVGIRTRRADRFGRDWITVGVVEAAAAIAIVAVPPTFYQAFAFTEKGEYISGAVTASTMMVGLFGAAIAIVGILYAISGVGLIPERARREQATA